MSGTKGGEGEEGDQRSDLSSICWFGGPGMGETAGPDSGGSLCVGGWGVIGYIVGVLCVSTSVRVVSGWVFWLGD